MEGENPLSSQKIVAQRNQVKSARIHAQDGERDAQPSKEVMSIIEEHIEEEAL